jgi:two-component system, OmpR family, copper resistance phosphate regulon response regulator CusR
VKVLIVDDDPSFRRLASLALAEATVEHQAVATANEALRVLTQSDERFDAILLDQELPGMKGSELLAALRQRGILTPVVLVSVREGVNEKIRALDLGADDYVVKPFEFEELVARLRAVLRRNHTADPVSVGNVELDPFLRRATKCGEPMSLTAREFEVLWLLVQAQGRAVSRAEFLRRVWDMDFDPETNSLQVHISRLRRKLGSNGGARIETVRRQGYRVVPFERKSPNGHLAAELTRQDSPTGTEISA